MTQLTAPTPEEIEAWLARIGRKRSWLAEQMNVSAATVKGWLSADRPITGSSLLLLRQLMEPSYKLNPDFTLSEWEQIEARAKAEGITPREWITRVLKRELQIPNLDEAKRMAPTVIQGPFLETSSPSREVSSGHAAGR